MKARLNVPPIAVLLAPAAAAAAAFSTEPSGAGGPGWGRGGSQEGRVGCGGPGKRTAADDLGQDKVGCTAEGDDWPLEERADVGGLCGAALWRWRHRLCRNRRRRGRHRDDLRP